MRPWSMPRASKRAVAVAWTLVALLTVALALWLIVTVVRQSNEIRETQAVNEAQDSALAEANRRLAEAGEPPVATPGPGPAGEPGQVGPQGPAGPPGPRGLAGPVGARGLQGIRGALGEPGAEGATGAAGATGAQGPAGPQGETGEQGPQGPAGPAGADGTDGQDGKDGQSAFPFTISWTYETFPGHQVRTTCTITSSTEFSCTTEDAGAQG